MTAERMFGKIVVFTTIMAALPGVGYAASCSVINLNRCLDSACAIGAATNPAARCQYCGSASAGTPPQDKMRNVSVGQSSKTTLTDKELKKAPTDPGERFMWARVECFKKIPNCTEDDTEKYEEMIQQSCDTVGIVSQKETLAKKVMTQSKKTKSSCQNTIMLCMVADKRCGADWAACSADAEFDNFFAACNIEATGCDEFSADVRTYLSNERKTTIAGAADRIKQLAKSHQDARKNKLTSAQNACKTNSQYTKCVENMCSVVMPGQCASNDPRQRERENDLAGKLCKHYELACQAVQNIQL